MGPRPCARVVWPSPAARQQPRTLGAVAASPHGKALQGPLLECPQLHHRPAPKPVRTQRGTCELVIRVHTGPCTKRSSRIRASARSGPWQAIGLQQWSQFSARACRTPTQCPQRRSGRREVWAARSTLTATVAIVMSERDHASCSRLDLSMARPAFVAWNVATPPWSTALWVCCEGFHHPTSSGTSASHAMPATSELWRP